LAKPLSVAVGIETVFTILLTGDFRMRRLPIALCILPLIAFVSAADKAPEKLGQKVENFALKDSDDREWSLADVREKKAVVILFVGTECPINNAYMPKLAELTKKYGERVAFVGINSNQQDTPLRIAAHAKQHKLPFPVLKDPANVIADRLGARRTPEALVLDGERRIVYQGRIDDQIGIGYKRPAPTRQDLVEALEEVLAGKRVSQPQTEVAGCLIARVQKPQGDGTITYSKQVARIVQNRCQECHRAGQVGPMPLLTYEDALNWSAMIREVVEEGRMPPWHADPKHDSFANDRRLSADEKKTLLGWIEQGCPKGDEKDLPEAKKFPEGWMIGKPDVVFTMPQAYTVPASAPRNGVRYQNFSVPTSFDEDRWIVAAEARPGNRAVVHHILVCVRPPAGRAIDRRDGIGSGLLVAFAPGDMPLMLPPGSAKKIPKGSTIRFQMHYTPNGIEQDDRSSVGLIFAREPPREEVRTRAIAQQWLAIPAGAANHEVRSTSRFDEDAVLYSLMPHMHLRGKDFRYEVVYPDDKREVILSVPHYDFGWQSIYRFAKPLKLPAGSRIECTAHFDNSPGNPNNPDPKKTVFWGEQTWEEMMIGFVDYAYAGK
jgi:peroxiredoxin